MYTFGDILYISCVLYTQWLTSVYNLQTKPPMPIADTLSDFEYSDEAHFGGFF